MFRVARFQRARKPYASLFPYSPVLQTVFSTAANKVAISVENPKSPTGTINFTYGQLQQDVVQLANILVEHKESLTRNSQKPSLSWMQPPRPGHIRGVFDQGEETPSCHVMPDNGTYNTAMLFYPGYDYVVSLLALWSLNQMAVPMCSSHKYDDELSYVLENSKSFQVLTEEALLKQKLPALFGKVLYTKDGTTKAPNTKCDGHGAAQEELYNIQTVFDIPHLRRNFAPMAPGLAEALHFDDTKLGELNVVFQDRAHHPMSMPDAKSDCLMIYTSGTTARPKGVVHTHHSIQNQILGLQTAWAWKPTDHILHMLPLHHVHGLVNILLCSLATGAHCTFTTFDNAKRIAQRLAKGDITLMMGVPTIYAKIIDAVKKDMAAGEQKAFQQGMREHVRLCVSGSAALPVPVLQDFRTLSGHTLLERYGMTEIGMALSQPLAPLEARIPATVGLPLPGVEPFVVEESSEATACLTEEQKAQVSQYDMVGKLAVSSDSLFDRYWGKPEATLKEVIEAPNGKRYFDTGDTVGVTHVATGPGAETQRLLHTNFAILGRTSVDILKSRGYKLSALEIESALLSRKDLFVEIAVVGVPRPSLGEEVTALCVLTPEACQHFGLSLAVGEQSEKPEITSALKAVANEIMVHYKCPGRYVILPALPRNAMGKVNKKSLKKQLNLA